MHVIVAIIISVSLKKIHAHSSIRTLLGENNLKEERCTASSVPLKTDTCSMGDECLFVPGTQQGWCVPKKLRIKCFLESK